MRQDNIIKIMKSTLPGLFRTLQLSNKQKHQQIKQSPSKQDPYYSLNLSFCNSYRTRIINKGHQKSIQQKNIPQSYQKNQKLRYSNYPNRSVSVQQQYDKSLSTLDNSSFATANNIQQIDNVRINIKRVNQQMFLLSKGVNQLTFVQNKLKQQLQKIKNKFANQLEQYEENFRGKVANLQKSLSQKRRFTSMQIKTMKRQINLIEEEVKQQQQIIHDIQTQRTHIRNVNF